MRLGKYLGSQDDIGIEPPKEGVLVWFALVWFFS